MKKLFVTFLVAAFATAVFGQTTTKTDIKPPQLPKCIAEWVKKNLPNWSIDKAYQLETKADSKVTYAYRVRMMKNKEFQWYLFDNNCVNVKKLSQAEAETDPPKPLPPIKGDPEKQNPPKK